MLLRPLDFGHPEDRQVEKFQISVKNLYNIWSFIEIHAVFALICVEKNLCGEMTNMRCGTGLMKGFYACIF